MSTRVIRIQRVGSNIEVSVVIQHAPGIRHNGIGRDELANHRVVIARPIIHQPRAIHLLAGVGKVGWQRTPTARPPVGVVLLRLKGIAAAVGHQHGGAQVVPEFIEGWSACR